VDIGSSRLAAILENRSQRDNIERNADRRTVNNCDRKIISDRESQDRAATSEYRF
jgi:hypothetical protein